MRNMTHCDVSVKPLCHKYKAIVPNATKLNINGSSYVYTIVPVAPSQPQGKHGHDSVWKSCPSLAFFLKCFSEGGGNLLLCNFFYAIIVLGPNFRERQMLFFFGGGQTASGVAPCGRKPGLSTNEPPVVLQRGA